MVRKKPVFHKNFTRDTSLILQQLWPICMEDDLIEIVPKNPYRPSVVDYLHNGTCEIWENDQAVNYIRKEFIKFSLKQPREALVLLKRFEEKKKPLEKIWRRGILRNLTELKKFIILVRDNMVGDLFILYIADADKVTGAVKKKAYALRDGDHYFSSSNKVIINTLKKLFPEVKDYINAIRYEDLDKIPSAAELRRRCQNYICVSNSYSKTQTLEKYARKTGYHFIEKKLSLVSDHLKGQTASPGRAIGRAKLIFTTRDLNKVKKGDIIISPMTTVNFMSAIRKAAAIVTDEGGVTCHAAIVARELHKPCLINTKAATKFFTDGDLVEVNTDKKLVKRLK